MVNEFRLTVVQTRCRSEHARGFTAGQKTVVNQNWATGPPGHRGLLGPLGRREPWAGASWPRACKTHFQEDFTITMETFPCKPWTCALLGKHYFV